MSLEGRLEDLGLPDIFQIINLSKRSGILTLIKKDGMGRIVFNQGNVVYASSDGKSRFGYTLLQKGLITRQDLERALAFQKARSTKKPIGTILVETGAVGREALETHQGAYHRRRARPLDLDHGELPLQPRRVFRRGDPDA